MATSEGLAELLAAAQAQVRVVGIGHDWAARTISAEPFGMRARTLRRKCASAAWPRSNVWPFSLMQIRSPLN